MVRPRIGRRRLVYRNRYQRVYRVAADFGEFAKEYFVLATGRRAGIVVLRNESVLLVKQYRLLVNGVAWEIPGGEVDDGETPAQAAVRECLEETGVRCRAPRRLIFYHVGLDTVDNPTEIFYSRQVAARLEPQRIHRNEVCGYDWIPFAKTLDMIARREIVDVLSIVGLLAYNAFAAKNRRQHVGTRLTRSRRGTK